MSISVGNMKYTAHSESSVSVDSASSSSEEFANNAHLALSLTKLLASVSQIVEIMRFSVL